MQRVNPCPEETERKVPMTLNDDPDAWNRKFRDEQDEQEAISREIILRFIAIQCRRQGRCPIVRCRRSGNCVKRGQALRDWARGRTRGGPIATGGHASALKTLNECLRELSRGA